jgi:hypothetical protein
MKIGAKEVSIHELAKEMLDAGYQGQGLRDQERAADYIYLAADNPAVESELPPEGFNFWKAAQFQFRVWQARMRRGVPMPPPVERAPAPKKPLPAEAGDSFQQAEAEALFNAPIAHCLRCGWFEKLSNASETYVEYSLTPFGEGALDVRINGPNREEM